MAFAGGLVERRRAGDGVGLIDVRAAQDEHLGDGGEAAAGGLVERRGAGLVADVDVGAADDEQRGQLAIAAVHGEVEGRLAGIIRRVQVGAVGQQQLDHGDIVLDAGVGQGLGAALGVTRPDVGAMVEEVTGDFEIAAPGDVVQGSGAHLVGLVDAGAGGDLLLDALEIAGHDGVVQVRGGAGPQSIASSVTNPGCAASPRTAPLLPPRCQSARARGVSSSAISAQSRRAVP